jgi:glycosyltransferase involved in cell wall biosynthesis
MLSDGTKVQYSGAPYWTGQVTEIREVLPESSLKRLNIDEMVAVLDYLHAAQIRLYQLALLTFSSHNETLATILHRVLAAPYISLAELKLEANDELVQHAPVANWSPHWQLTPGDPRDDNWEILETHTGQQLNGLGTTKIFDVIGVLLSLSGLLQSGIAMSPLDPNLVRPLKPSHPIWGFQPRQFSIARTHYQADDVRALALGFLETLPATYRVSMFRSRLAIHFITKAWSNRKSASVTTDEDGFYRSVIRAAQLIDQNRFAEVQRFVESSAYRLEPALQFLHKEAISALDLFALVKDLPSETVPQTIRAPKKILCVTHASVPDQTGGYAIRAHGVLTSLKNRGIDISAVTRPGFPAGALTKVETVTVDGVEYQRLPDTGVHREHGEIQHMLSFIQPYKDLFAETGVGIVHLRSTFLIALPALIAARQLGLKVVYEVSGLWELVYRDREKRSHLLKRSPFAEFAETLTMTHVDKIVVMNEAVRQIIFDRGVSPEHVRVAPNAVDVENFKPLSPPKNETFTVGYLGSFQDYEGLDDLVEAVRLLQEEGTPVRVLMVGDGFRFNPLRSKIAQEGLEDIFTLTGRVPHTQVLEYYQQMDVLVYPRWSTGATESITPLKPFEALALEKPIIVSDVAPLQEIVGDNERGLVFRSGNIEDLAHAIQRLSQDPELRMALGQAGRTWVVKHRNWDNVVATFIEAYNELG